MNPPTPGHLLLVRKIIEEAILHNSNKVYILLSKTENDIENPLNCKYKQTILGNDEDTKITDSMIENEKKLMIDETSDTTLKDKISKIEVITKFATYGSPV